MKLKRDSDGNIGMNEENIINFANHYLKIMTKINKGESLSEDEKTNLMLLLHKTANEMLEKPKNYLNKKQRGRTNKFTGNRVKKHINILLAVSAAKTLGEAREKTAKHLNMSLDAVDKQSRNMDIDKYININK